jgi:PAS domain S-box-containing protein
LRQLAKIGMPLIYPERGVYGLGVAHLASFGLASVLILLSIFAMWGALSTYQAGSAAKHFEVLSDAFEGARAAVAAEESLERKYRLEPSASVRGRHHDASVTLQTKLTRARVLGDAADRAVIGDVLALHEKYLVAIFHMFAAVDVGDTALANVIDGNEVDPRFDEMEARVVAASDAHHAEAFRRLDRLVDVQKSLLVATPVVFAIGMGLVVFFGLVLRNQRRRTAQAIMHETMAVGRSEKRLRALIQNAFDVVLVCGADGAVAYQSPTAETNWGYAEDGLLGRPLQSMVHPDDQPAFEKLLAQLQVAHGSTRGVELRLRDSGGAWCQVELILTNLLNEPDVAGLVVTARDIAQRKAFEARLIEQAFQDPLTRLPNRALFVDRLEQALVRTTRRQGSVGVLFLDLDNFKLINDSLGHLAGDELLVEVAARVQSCLGGRRLRRAIWRRRIRHLAGVHR